MRDPYEVLGVPKSASDAEIKKAFRSLAKKHHPDTKGGDKAAQKRFQEISAAYDIVGDKEKRVKFDAGQIDAGGNPRGFDPRAHGYEGGPFSQRAPIPAISISPGPIRATKAKPPKVFARKTFSPICLAGLADAGAGAPSRAPGRISPCRPWSASRKPFMAERGAWCCPTASRSTSRFPPGLKDGQQIRLKGRGGAGRSGGPPGDVLIHVAVAPHPRFMRDGRDLKVDLPITLKEAVLGGKVPVETLTGTVSLSVPPNSNTGTVLRLKGKGIPAHSGEAAGDLYARLVVTLPDGEDAELKKFAEGWRATYDPRAKLK